jgi:predicted aminopeptidase
MCVAAASSAEPATLLSGCASLSTAAVAVRGDVQLMAMRVGALWVLCEGLEQCKGKRGPALLRVCCRVQLLATS